MKIYTRGGDKGKTNIHGGQRVDKDDVVLPATFFDGGDVACGHSGCLKGTKSESASGRTGCVL